MRYFTFFNILCAIICLFCLYTHTFADDVTLELNDGTELLLHEDYTWDYIKPKSSYIKKDVSVNVDNKKIIVIKKDRTWHYQSESYHNFKNDSVKNYTVYSSGTAQCLEQYRSHEKALASAIDYLALHIKKSHSIPEDMMNKLKYCIQNGDKQIDTREERVNEFWKVTIKLSLDEEQFEQIIQCSEDNLE